MLGTIEELTQLKQSVIFVSFTQLTSALVFHLLHLLNLCIFSLVSPQIIGKGMFLWLWMGALWSVDKEQCSVSYMQPKLCPLIWISRGQSQQFYIFWKGTLQWKHFTSGSNCSAAECFQRWKDLFISADCEPLSNSFSWKQYLLVRAVSSVLVSGSPPTHRASPHLSPVPLLHWL